MFGEVEDQPKKTKKESSRRFLKSSVANHLSLEYEGVLTSSRSSRRFLKSSVANDLSLEYEGVLTSSGAEDLSSLRQSMLKDFFQTHYTFLTMYIVISCIDVDLIWRSDQVSHAFNAWGTINMKDGSSCKITSSQAFKLSKCTGILSKKFLLFSKCFTIVLHFS
ncbi:hypothetical protein L6452_42530 [Arctium lappa]|uniref:Uncharacterized protein n=1 Tax=Arctium lappa TaxID=4217 RepID=A0ACB8XML4_ARCLA|nr:hypothetical protein L6452_42530 [Arctium lappa]